MGRIVLLLLCVLPALSAPGMGNFSDLVLILDFPSGSQESKYTPRLFYGSPSDTLVHVRINSFYCGSGPSDSVNLYDVSFESVRLPKGAHYIDLPFSKALSTHKMHADYSEVIRLNGQFKAEQKKKMNNEK